MLDYNEDDWFYVVAHEDVLLTKGYLEALGKKLNERAWSRLKATEWLDNKLFHELDRMAFFTNGEPFELYPDIIDDAYGHEESFRWNTDIKRYAKRPPCRLPNRSLLLRLRLWDLAFKIDNDPIIP